MADQTLTLSPTGAVIGAAGDILGAITSWYAVGEQRKENAKALELQEKLFYENLGFEREQAAQNYGLSLRQIALNERSALSAQRLGNRQQRLSESTARAQTGLANRSMTLQETESAASRGLAERGMGLQEKTTEADIGFKNREIAIAERTAKFNQAATMITNMTSFFNSPSTRGQYANLWKGYGR